MKKSMFNLGTASLLSLCLVLGACSTKETAKHDVSGAKSAVVTIDKLIVQSNIQMINRSAALLGLYVAEYLTNVPRAQAADSALLGIGAQMQIFVSQSTVQDPDFELLQAFGDALQVNVPDLLNRSVNRQEALETYTVALTNIATRSNDRYKELQSVLDEIKVVAREQSKTKSEADRSLQKAIREKNFAEASEKQKALNDATAQFAETDLKQKQIQDLVDTFKTMLDLYGKKILAIQNNREALIAGVKVIDLPGVDELDVLEKQKTPSRRNGDFDSLFEDTNIP